MMFSLAKRDEVIAVADVGSGSVGCALVRTHPHAPAEILAAERGTLPVEERSDEAAIAASAALLGEAMRKMLDTYTKGRGGPPVSRVHCIVRSPWTRARTAAARATFEDGAAVHRGIVQDLSKKALAQIPDLDAARFLEASVVRIEINGYPTRKPEGKRAQELAVTAFASDCEPAARGAFEKVLTEALPHLKPVMRSGARALFSVLRDATLGSDYFVVELFGNGTVMRAIRDGAIAETGTAREGVRSILMRLGSAPDSTLATFRLMARDQCQSAACLDLQKSLASVEPDLVRAFAEPIGTLATERKLPNTLILLTYPDLAPWLAQFFARIDFAQFTRTSQPFAVEILSTEHFRSRVVSRAAMAPDSGLLVAVAASLE